MTTGDGDLFFRLIFVPVDVLGRRGRLPSQVSHLSVMENALFLLSIVGLGLLVLENGVPLDADEKGYLSNRSFAFETEL